MSSSQVKSSHKSQKMATGVRLESTINAVIEGIHVHRSVKLFLVLLRGLRGAPQSLSTARTLHARPSLCPRKIPAGTCGSCTRLAVYSRGLVLYSRGFEITCGRCNKIETYFMYCMNKKYNSIINHHN